MKIIFIRHGATDANLQKRYIGRTDLPLCEEGRSVIRSKATRGCYPAADKVCSSPLLRCRETADIIYPDQTVISIEDFREKDFGEYEMKNYEDLKEDPRYLSWVESGGRLPFPAGEDDGAVRERVLRAFDETVKECIADGTGSIALTVHGGTIMTILSERLTEGRGGYYDYQCACGAGYIAECDQSGMRIIGEIE